MLDLKHWRNLKDSVSCPRIGLSVVTLACLAVSAWPVGARAQETPSFETIRTTNFAAIDRTTVNDWLDAQLQDLLRASDNLAALRSGSALYVTLLREVNHPDASQAYQDGLAELMAQSGLEAYRRRDPETSARVPFGAMYALMIGRMGTARMNEPPAEAVDTFRNAIGNEASSVRLVAADALRDIRERLNEQQWSQVVATIRQTALEEADPVTLGRLVEVLFAENPARASAAIPAVEAILESRVEQIESKGLLPAPVDAQMAEFLAPRAAGSDNSNFVTSAANLAGRLLADAAYFYTRSSRGDIRNKQLERVIKTAEDQLKQIVRSKAAGVSLPDVTGAMLNNITEEPDVQTKAMNEALAAWIGQGETQGVLNRAPFNLPVGLAIERTVAGPTEPVSE
jgi:hypothetical protein